MKKYLAILLTAALLLCAAPLVGFTAIDWPEINFGNLFPSAEAAEIVDSGTCGEVDEEKELDGSQVTWTLDSDGLLTISGSGKIVDYGIFGDSPRFNDTSIKTIVIQSGITSIGRYVFSGCTNLTNVTIPDSVMSVGDSAFSGCTGLTSVTIPDSVTNIGISAFEDCSGLTSVTISNSVTTIEYAVFSGCTDLTSVTIPDSVTSIGRYAFYGCTGLASVIIPDSVMIIEDDAFAGCTKLMSVTIPDSVTSIGGSAFYNCAGLTSVTIGNSVTNIGRYAFFGCNNLTSVTIPDGVTSIGESVFFGCTELKEISVGSNNTVYYSKNNCVIEKDTQTLVLGCRSSEIPTDGSVTGIGSYAFAGCVGLTNVTIPDSVLFISSYAFYKCTSLTDVIIPDCVTSINSGTFYGCTSLASVTIPDGVKTIQYGAFKDCVSLTVVTIPHNVSSIGEEAFFGCAGLKEFRVDPENENCCAVDGVLYNKEITELLYYPMGKSGDSFTVPSSVRTIQSNAFSSDMKLKKLTIPTSVTEIHIESDCFDEIVYSGTREQWNEIEKDVFYTFGYNLVCADNPIKSVSVTCPVKLYKKDDQKRFYLPVNMLALSVEYKNGETEAFRYNTAVNDGLYFKDYSYDDWDVGTHRITAYYNGVKTFVDFEVVPYQKEDYPTIPIKEQTKTCQWSSYDINFGKADGHLKGSVQFDDITYLFFGSGNDAPISTIIKVDSANKQTEVFSVKDFLETITGETISINYYFVRFEYDSYEDTEKTVRFDFFCRIYDKGTYDPVLYSLTTTDGVNFTQEKSKDNDSVYYTSVEGTSRYEFVNDYYFDTLSPRYSKDKITWTEIELPACSGRLPDLKKLTEDGERYIDDFGEYYHYYSFGAGVLINRCFGQCYGGWSDFGRPFLDANLGLYYTEDFITFTSIDEIPLYEAISVVETKEKDPLVFIKTFVTNQIDGHWTDAKVFSVTIDADNIKTKLLCESPYENTYDMGNLFVISEKNNFLLYYMMDQIYFFSVETENGGTFTPKWLPFYMNQWNSVHKSDDTFDVTALLVDRKELYATDSSFADLLHIPLPQEILDANPLSIIIIGNQFVILCENKLFFCDREILRESKNFLPGDVDCNGKVESADARLALRASVGLEKDIVTGTIAFQAADMDGDGNVTSADARKILRISVGLENASPEHNWSAWTNSDETSHMRVCADDPSHVETAEHVWDKETVTKEATVTEEGVKTFTCSVCGAEKTEAIPKLPPEQPEQLLGDVDGNGKVESGDARLALRASVKLEDYAEGTAPFLAADYDKNNRIESADARAILRVSVSLDPFA